MILNEISLNPFVITVVLLNGLIIGSFLNVCIVRIPLEQSVAFPPSRCNSCETKIPWYLNIPILSWLFLRGKCQQCKTSISARYPLVEALTAGLIVVALFQETYWIAFAFAVYLMASLIISTFVDLEHWIIPDKVTLPGIFLGLVSAFLIPERNFLDQFLGMIVGGGSLLLIGYIYLKWKNIEGIGGGDIKFLAMGGAFLGVQKILLTLVLSSLIGTVIGTVAMVLSGKGSKTAIPFGPAISIALLVSYLYGTDIIQWYLDLPRATYGMIMP